MPAEMLKLYSAGMGEPLVCSGLGAALFNLSLKVVILEAGSSI